MKAKIAQILMLDSHENLSSVIRKYFSNHSINIIAINNLPELTSKLKQELPDCIILDTLMLTNDIYNLVKKLKSNKSIQHIPVIFLTAKGLTQDRISGYRIGCSAYISKPFDPKELHAIIKNLIYHRQLSVKSVLENYISIKEIKLILKEKILSSSYSQTKLALTKQEINILTKIIKGQTTKQIEAELRTTKRNIEKYLTRLFDKTQVSNLKELKHLPWESIIETEQANDGNRTRG